MALDLSGLMAPLAAPPTAAAEFTRTFYQPQQQALAQQLGKAQVSTLQQKLAEAPLEEQLKQAQIGGLQGQQELLPFRAALMQAQAKKAQELAKHPFLDRPMIGPAAEIESIERLKELHGKDSQQVKDASARFKASTGAMNAKAQFYGRTNIEKVTNYRDQQQVLGNTDNVANANATLSKMLSDPQTRQQYESLNGLVQEIDKIKMPHIAKYAGLIGKANLEKDRGLATVDNILGTHFTPPSYQTYRNFGFAAKAITDQLRKALKTSTRSPYVMQMLYPLVNNFKEVWGNNPELALSQWKWLTQWTHHLTGLYHYYAMHGVPAKEIESGLLNDPNMQDTAPGMPNYTRSGKTFNPVMHPPKISAIKMPADMAQTPSVPSSTIAPSEAPATQATKPAPPVPKDQWIAVMMKDPKTKGSGITRPQLEAYFDAHFDAHAKKEGQ